MPCPCFFLVLLGTNFLIGFDFVMLLLVLNVEILNFCQSQSKWCRAVSIRLFQAIRFDFERQTLTSRQAMPLHTDYGHPDRAFFSKIRNFWAWADKLGRNFMRHLGYFWPNYKHYFGTVSPLSMGKCSWFSFLQKTLVFRSKTYNSQILPK